MKTVFPNYDKSIVNLISSIENYFGIKNERKTIEEVDDLLKENNYKNIVLVLYDGFGYNLLTRNKDITPFLNENLKTKISSVYPPTTTAATTSFLTGQTPYEHGWLGWDMYMKKYDSVVTLFLNVEKETEEKIEGYKTSYDELPIIRVADKISMIPGCEGSIVWPFGDVSYSDIDDMNKKILDITKNDKKNYIYAYYEDPDAIMHMTGTDSIDTLNTFSMIDKKFKELCDLLEDSLVIMVADHGHINSEFITLTDYPKIINMLKGTTGLDSRASSFRVKEEYKKEFEEEIKKILKDDFILLSKEEVYEKKIFGDGNRNPNFDSGIGDFIAVATNDKCIRYSENHEAFASNHAGITEDEVYIPLVLVNKKERLK